MFHLLMLGDSRIILRFNLFGINGTHHSAEGDFNDTGGPNLRQNANPTMKCATSFAARWDRLGCCTQERLPAHVIQTISVVVDHNGISVTRTVRQEREVHCVCDTIS